MCVHVCLCVSGTSQITKSSPHVYKAWNKWRIKEISLGNNNRHHISVAAKIIPLSSVGCLTGRMGVNPLTFFFLSCLCENCWLSSASTSLAFGSQEAAEERCFSSLTHSTDRHQSLLIGRKEKLGLITGTIGKKAWFRCMVLSVKNDGV